MTICDDCFQEFLHPLVHELTEKNNRFRDRFGIYARWDWDGDSATITFSDPEKPPLQIPCTVVGTIEGDQWEWTWANKNFEPVTKVGMNEVKAFGEEKCFDQLTTAFLDADEYTGWEVTAVTAHLLNAPGAYRFPTGHGYCFVIFRELPVSAELVN